MHDTRPQVGIELPSRDGKFDTAPGDTTVLPIEALTVVPDREFTVRHDDCPVEPMQYKTLCHIRLLNQIAVLYRREVSENCPGGSGEARRLAGHWLPPEPIENVIRAAASLGRFRVVEPVLVRIRGADANDAIAEKLVHLDAAARLNLVIPRIAFGVGHHPKACVGGEGHGVVPRGVDRSRLLEVRLR